MVEGAKKKKHLEEFEGKIRGVLKVKHIFLKDPWWKMQFKRKNKQVQKADQIKYYTEVCLSIKTILYKLISLLNFHVYKKYVYTRRKYKLSTIQIIYEVNNSFFF